ncbi:unnamed protein product [Lampetra fluviatilis]
MLGTWVYQPAREVKDKVVFDYDTGERRASARLVSSRLVLCSLNIRGAFVSVAAHLSVRSSAASLSKRGIGNTSADVTEGSAHEPQHGSE